MMTNAEIEAVARAQSAVDCHCTVADFDAEEPCVVVSEPDERCRKYLQLPFICQLVSYGNNVVASVSPELVEPIEDYLRDQPPAHAFETPRLHRLEELLRPQGASVCFMASYFLPDVTRLTPQPCAYTLRRLEPPAFDDLYVPEWSNALCDKRRELDVLGVGAYDGEQLIGLAACSADCDTMWQIGVDVLPAYRRQGVAAAVTSRLAQEILFCGKVPFYCAAWSNVRSVRNALRSGFRPAWVEVTAKNETFVQGLR